jgi:hypothetical protein
MRQLSVSSQAPNATNDPREPPSHRSGRSTRHLAYRRISPPMACRLLELFAQWGRPALLNLPALYWIGTLVPTFVTFGRPRRLPAIRLMCRAD